MPTTPSHETVATMIDAVEQEMRAAGLWQDAPLEPAAYDFAAAFAMDTMAFPQWLQFIFVPRVRSIIEERGDFPSESHVAAQAVREFDGVAEADRLVALLSQFDAVINGESE